MRLIGLIALAALVGGMAYVRLAPSDPARWHVDPGLALAGQGEWARLTLPGTTPAAVLDRLDAIAMATPRTVRLAGSPAEGRITWITRSAVLGFPDYTTAAAREEAGSTLLVLHARQRFGLRDMGVNAARLRDWTGQIAP
ncbi:DUF1499 domain-containing protein [Albidovulum sediminis]|uniref:DUF1499 domain-containing protein n=1 Tax=Albidovulum sediminis TaxID=3066345 RepID=A0ABT2NI95_9RHOB|nr:DUF1499 domain-containing protein [Defluviimonas sediminis]